MKLKIYLSMLLTFFTLSLLADTEETVTVADAPVGKFATSISFSGENVILTFSDGTSQTADMHDVKVAFDYTAELSEVVGFDNLSTLKTFGKRTVNVNVVRSLKKDQWNTLCLPFDLPAASVAELFGTGTKVAEFDITDNGSSVNFNTVEDILCGIPYLIQPAQDVDEFSLQNVVLSNLISGNTMLGVGYNFVGTILAEVPEGVIYYFANGNKLKKLAAGNTIRPFHAYLSAIEGDSGITTFTIDDETLGIENVQSNHAIGSFKIYNLGGQFVGNTTVGLPKGVYIVNGRKVVVK